MSTKRMFIISTGKNAWANVIGFRVAVAYYRKSLHSVIFLFRKTCQIFYKDRLWTYEGRLFVFWRRSNGTPSLKLWNRISLILIKIVFKSSRSNHLNGISPKSQDRNKITLLQNQWMRLILFHFSSSFTYILKYYSSLFHSHLYVETNKLFLQSHSHATVCGSFSVPQVFWALHMGVNAKYQVRAFYWLTNFRLPDGHSLEACHTRRLPGS